MGRYEIMYIVDAKLGVDSRSVGDSVVSALNSLGAVNVKNDFFGKRRFAYKMKGGTEGIYSVVRFDVDEGKISELRNKLSLLQGISRYMINKLEKGASGSQRHQTKQ